MNQLEVLQNHIDSLKQQELTKNLFAHLIDLDFNHVPEFWFRNSPLMTYYENSLSIFISVAEHFMINTVHEAATHIQFDAGLTQNDINVFCEQEDNHAWLHAKFNATLIKNGFDTELCINHINKLFDGINKNFNLSERIILTAAFETVTASIAAFVIQNTQIVDIDMDERVKPLYIWHCLEELEHRNVAYLVSKYYHGHKHTVSLKAMFVLFKLMTTVFYLTFRHLWRKKLLFKFQNMRELCIMFFSKKGVNYHVTRGIFKFFFVKSYDPQSEYDLALSNNYIETWENNFHK